MDGRSNGSSAHALVRTRPRFWLTLQPYIVRLYKIAGLVALSAILIGLVGFLVVNIFYFFDHTWVRPSVLDERSPKVIEASTQLADAKLRARQLDTERLEIEAQLAEIKRTTDADDKFLAEVGNQADAPKTPEAWLVHREVEKTKLDKENALGRQTPLQQRLESLALRVKDQEQLVHRLESSPYLMAVNKRVQLAFVPYSNRGNIKPEIPGQQEGTKLYGCHWGLVWCKVVGKVVRTIDGEVQDIHPHDESVQRGFMVEIRVDKDWEGEAVLFAGSKPLVFF